MRKAKQSARGVLRALADEAGITTPKPVKKRRKSAPQAKKPARKA